MTQHRIIGITGPAGAGKDTIAALLASAYGYRIDSFAAPLYAMLAALTGQSIATLKSRDAKESESFFLGGRSPRYALQTLGTEWGRELIHPDLWVRALYSRWQDELCPATVVSDVRFVNEAKWIKENGLLISVNRATDPVHDHISENDAVWALADVTFDNNGSITDLHGRVMTYFDKLLGMNTDAK